MGFDTKKVGERVWKDRPYLRNLITELFFKDPEEILKSIPSIYEQLERDPGFEQKIKEIVNKHRKSWETATRIDIYDAIYSAAQIASLASTYGLDLPVERIAEILETLPKLPYIYSYSKKMGMPYALVLALYELVSILDPTNILDILPTYRAAEIYSMYRELKQFMKKH
ncbi:MAG: hypothetical protein KQA41_02185 [Candidatus Aenigmarchaeota archaeon]|nr:hypothetical protein [Candidatus Aenigmarchaeota archaeon]MBU5689010.1 hypothetical protein [Candidatus Aenigmarchaeota archaeon]